MYLCNLSAYINLFNIIFTIEYDQYILHIGIYRCPPTSMEKLKNDPFPLKVKKDSYKLINRAWKLMTLKTCKYNV